VAKKSISDLQVAVRTPINDASILASIMKPGTSWPRKRSYFDALFLSMNINVMYRVQCVQRL